jgi:hypothetical protein
MLHTNAAMIEGARAWFHQTGDGDANYSDQTGTRAISLRALLSLVLEEELGKT